MYSDSANDTADRPKPLSPQAPVFRELYSEKRVVTEERRLRVDDSPMGGFQEAFSAKAFANNYGRPVIGWPADFQRLGRREVRTHTVKS